MNSIVITILLLSGLATNLCWCAPQPRIQHSSRFGASLDLNNEINPDPNAPSNTDAEFLLLEEPMSIEQLTGEVKTMLRLVKLLPSEISHRKVSEAVVILEQVLQNPNPILHLAVENALRDVQVTSENSNPSASRLLSYLNNFKEQLSTPGSSFPRKFSDWMLNQIVIVERTVAFNIDGINKLGESGEGDIESVVSHLESTIDSFGLFIQSRLAKLMKQPSLQFDVDLSAFNDYVISGKYHRVFATIVWDLITSHQSPNLDATNNPNAVSSISFFSALQEVYKRSSPDLQPIPEAVLRSIEVFLKSLSHRHNTIFIIQLGQWNPHVDV